MSKFLGTGQKLPDKKPDLDAIIVLELCPLKLLKSTEVDNYLMMS
jgi:hypothetical protein